jgi:hypothetical protein
MKLVLGLIALLFVFTTTPAFAKDHKDCWMYMVSNLPDAPNTPPVMKYRDEAKWKVKLKDHLTKDQCLDNNKGKDQGCDGMLKQCGANQQTPAGPAGLVGAWIQWGTSRESCPKNCPGFEKANPVKFAPL